jgi:hypothetical protein
VPDAATAHAKPVTKWWAGETGFLTTLAQNVERKATACWTGIGVVKRVYRDPPVLATCRRLCGNIVPDAAYGVALVDAVPGSVRARLLQGQARRQYRSRAARLVVRQADDERQRRIRAEKSAGVLKAMNDKLRRQLRIMTQEQDFGQKLRKTHVGRPKSPP